jgi:hypothetical protein
MTTLRRCIVAFLFLTSTGFAQSTGPATRATTTSTTQPALPLLAALDAETRQLYQLTESRIVRVHVPMPVPVDEFLARFDPKVRAQLRPNAPRLFVRASASTQAVQVGPQSNLIPLPSANATLNVECVGLILNQNGDVLLPLFIDPEFVRGPMAVNVDEVQATTARVVGADRLTALTIVRLAEPAAVGEIAKFSKLRPTPGSIMLMLSPTQRQARIGVWTGISGGQDENVILINRDARVAGIVRNGHALYPKTFAPIVDQLLATGTIRRAQLGVQIMAVRGDDPQRVQVKDLGARPAARVMDVLDDSAAAKAGVQPGDLILSLAGEAVEDIPTFAAALANKSGATELIILRDGEPRKIVVDLKVQ